MEKETKNETTTETTNYAKTNDDYYNDYYDEEYVEDYHHNYKVDTKKDAGATKFKKGRRDGRVPLYKIDLDTVIIDEPQEKVEKPNEHHFNKEINRIQEQIDKHKESLKKLREKLAAEKTGNNPEAKQLREELTKLNEEIGVLKIKIEEIESKNKGPVEKSKSLKLQREKLEKECTYTDVKRIEAEVLGIQEQLGYAKLSATEEKKLMEKKRKIELQIPTVKKIAAIRAEIKELRDANNVSFDELKKLRDQRTVLFERRKVIHTKLDLLNKTFTENKQNVELIKTEMDSIRKANQALFDERKKVDQEYYEKKKKYKEYEDVMNYITQARKIQNDLKKQEEKAKRKAEKEAKKENKDNANVEIELVKTGETEELKSCKILLSYFNNLLPKKEEEKKDEKVESNQEISEDLKDLELFNRDALNNQQEITVSGAKTKKKKGPKVSKQEKKELSSEYLLLDVQMAAKIKELGLSAPQKKTQVEAFVKTLDAKLVELKEISKKMEEEEKKNAEKRQKEAENTEVTA